MIITVSNIFIVRDSIETKYFQKGGNTMKNRFILTISALTIFTGVFNEQRVNAQVRETSDVITRNIDDERYDDRYDSRDNRYVTRRYDRRPYSGRYYRDYDGRRYRRYYDSNSRRYRRDYYDDYNYDNRRGGRVLRGAATGALIGGVAGGGRGAGIGAGVGAGLGLFR